MHLTQFLLTAFVLAAQICPGSAKAVTFVPAIRRHNDLHESMRKASEFYEGELERRSPLSTDSVKGAVSLTQPSNGMNSTVQTACMSAMQSMSNITNEAGFAACYNVLEWSPDSNMFQADLRLYQMADATGNFANISMSEITVLLTFPNSTQFSILMNTKRSLASLENRDTSTPTQIQQYTLVGSFKDQLSFSKLNSTEEMSLVIPLITLQATSSNETSVTSDIAVSDVAYFVAGQFKDQATPQLAAQAANPSMAAAAVTAGSPYDIPGRHLGIFPTGLIVTCAWTLLFFITFGVGTLGRIRHRNAYRKRVAAAPKNGKR